MVTAGGTQRCTAYKWCHAVRPRNRAEYDSQLRVRRSLSMGEVDIITEVLRDSNREDMTSPRTVAPLLRQRHRILGRYLLNA